MKFEKLGYTDIEISKLCIGGMSFGKAGTMHDWTLDVQTTEEIVKYALDNGINFFDTANSYSKGTGEEYLGKALKKNISREKVVIASKVYFNPGRLSKKAINQEIESTLRRLGTDYLDLYIIHRFDYQTPIEETMEALNELVQSGKVRALGASAMYGYQFHNMQNVAKENNWTQFSAMENHYNLLYREDERELIPICQQMGVSLMPYSPLAAGRLARPEWLNYSIRSKTDLVSHGKYDRTKEHDSQIAKRVSDIANKYGVGMSQVAIAWQWAKGITSPIIGVTKKKYIDDGVNAFNIKLSSQDIEYLEELYVPHPIVGAIDQNPPEGVVLLDAEKKVNHSLSSRQRKYKKYSPRLNLGVFY
ncbi:aldo/keto reductase, partial [Listeria valentina]|uniref:aldo/keto reductase n=1 Tax=Listeria valentina TaxID=2705293 RepID=UPI001430A590